MKNDINQVCYECGVTANVLTCLKRFKAPPKKLCYLVSTYHEGVCDFCKKNMGVVGVRDFYYPDFSLLQKNWILKLGEEIKFGVKKEKCVHKWEQYLPEDYNDPSCSKCSLCNEVSILDLYNQEKCEHTFLTNCHNETSCTMCGFKTATTGF